jgi:TPR repeat protein
VSATGASGTCDDLERCALECNGTNGDACRRLAVVYEFGKSDAGRNERLAASYYDRSCALGDAPGCVSSAQMHEHGHGVPSNLTFAAGAYSRACTLGSNVGCANWERVKALTSAAPAASAAP